MPAAAATDRRDTLLEELSRRFGHADFRPGQREIVETVRGGEDAVVVMPTGGGKSLCYQLPAVLRDAPTVVVSPLIALMKDQVDALRRRGIAAAALHSNLDQRSQRDIEADYRRGALDLLYVAPERLIRTDLRAMLVEHRPGCVVVDEAHCISEWGHDFRRDYLRIAEVTVPLRPLQVIACTATATPAVREDIATRLGLRQPRIFVHGFGRPELHLSVHRVRDEAAKLTLLDELVDPGAGHVIVYAGTRARAAAVAARLGARQPTMLYHADLDAATRAMAHERFASGEVRVAVATSAFGMGVDVSSVRQVIHLALPSSLEEYYQQAGRAGRDGAPARCAVIHAPADRRLPEFFIEAAHPDPATLAAVYRSLRAEGRDPGAWRLVASREAAVSRLSDAGGDAARELLREAGVVEPDGEVVAHDPSRLPVDHARVASHRRLAYRRFGDVVAYLRGGVCRHRFILDHFGEPGGAARCGDGCDVCGAPPPPTTPPLDPTPVRQALSAVARLNGRFGGARIAAVLCGSKRRDLAEAPGATSIPTYGALASWREADVVELLRRLVDAGLLQQAPPPYPTLSLSSAGVAALRGDEMARIEDPRSAGPAGGGGRGRPSAASAELDVAGRALFERLRAWRTELARERKIPPYVVFADRTLVELALRVPRSEASLLAVPGVGPGKLALYGGGLLALFRGLPADDPGGSSLSSPDPPTLFNELDD